jgi:hypothetical protein
MSTNLYLSMHYAFIRLSFSILLLFPLQIQPHSPNNLPLVDGHCRWQFSAKFRKKSHWQGSQIFDSWHNTPIGTLETQYSATAVLAPLVARFENRGSAISKLNGFTCPNTFCSYAFQSESKSTLKMPTFHVFILWNEVLKSTFLVVTTNVRSVRSSTSKSRHCFRNFSTDPADPGVVTSEDHNMPCYCLHRARSFWRCTQDINLIRHTQ